MLESVLIEALAIDAKLATEAAARNARHVPMPEGLGVRARRSRRWGIFARRPVAQPGGLLRLAD